MPGLTSATFTDSAATPGRRTTVTFDLDETVLLEPPWGVVRGPGEIQAASFDGVGESFGVEQLKSNWWGLSPINSELFEMHEIADANPSGIMDLSEFNHNGQVASYPTFKAPADIPGAMDGASPDLSSSGSNWFDLLQPAGQSWNNPLATALPPPPVPKSLRTLTAVEHVTLDRVAEATTVHDPDTGYMLSFFVPSSPHGKPDWVMRFYFGGSATDEHLGTFCLLLGGNGLAVLYERSDDLANAPTVPRWLTRTTWRYANPQATVNTVHRMRILPHARRFIEFASQMVDQALPVGSVLGNKLFQDPSAATKWLYTIPPADAAKRAQDQPHVTGAGSVKFDVRRDLRLTWQVARLVYRTGDATDTPPPGQIVDLPVCIPWGVEARVEGVEVPISFKALLGRRVFSATRDPNAPVVIETRLYDAATGTLLEQQSTDPFDFLASGGTNTIVPVIKLPSGDAYHSTYLLSYALSRPKVTRAISPGEFTGGELKSVSITGPDNDPTHETARVVIQDPRGELPRLAIRGGFSVAIKTEYDGGAGESVLFRGYARSPRRRPIGPVGVAFPPALWAEYEIDCIGQWRRLQAGLKLSVESFWRDESAEPGPDGGQPPWKVSDVIRKLLGDAGYDDDQLDVPDNPMRLWVSPDLSETEAQLPAVGARILDYCQRLAFDYLGGFLLWDANAGDAGMWRLRLQPVFTTPLWSFISVVEESTVPKLAHSLASYPDGVSPILKVNGTPSLVTWVEPPEANAVKVTAPGPLFPEKGTQLVSHKWAVNKAAVDWPAFGSHADANDPDFYGGFFEPIIESAIFVNDGAKGEEAATWMCRRLYDFACRARPMASFTSHLVLVADPNDPQLASGKRRALRYGDSVLLDGAPALVRSCNPDWDKEHGGDAVMLAAYQVQKWVPPA